MSIQKLYQDIAQKILEINIEYKQSKNNMVNVNTMEKQEHQFVHYYQKLDDEVVPELMELHKINPDASADILNNLINSDYREILMEEIKGGKTNKNISLKITEDMVKSRAKWLKVYQENIRKDNTQIEEFRSRYYYRPFLNENKAKFVVLLKEDVESGLKALVDLQDYKLQRALCSKKYNQPAFDILCSELLNKQRDLRQLRAFCEKFFYYDPKKRDSKDKKLHIKVILDAVDKLSLNTMIGPWLRG